MRWCFFSLSLKCPYSVHKLKYREVLELRASLICFVVRRAKLSDRFRNTPKQSYITHFFAFKVTLLTELSKLHSVSSHHAFTSEPRCRPALPFTGLSRWNLHDLLPRRLQFSTSLRPRVLLRGVLEPPLRPGMSIPLPRFLCLSHRPRFQCIKHSLKLHQQRLFEQH
jgi:hypothetical protein